LRLLAFAILWWTAGSSAWAAVAIDSAALAPTSVPVGVASVVTVTAVISDPAVLPDGVNLQRLDTAGRVVGVMGLLKDDGANGDVAAGDRIFTLRATMFEQAPGPIRLRVSAAFRGSLVRALSSPLTLNVLGTTGTGITILSPADLAYLNVSPITVSGTVGDPGASVVVNGVAASGGGGTFQASVPLVEGTNTLTAVATNTGGTTSTASVQVTLDTTPPRLTIESPADNLETVDAAVTVSGTVNDIVVGTVNSQQAQVTVNGMAAQVANRSFLASGVALSLGPNTIQAIGRDRSGNFVTTSVHVTRVPPTEPFIRIVSGNNQSGPVSSVLPQKLVVALDNGSGQPVANTMVVFRVTDNNGLVTGGGATDSSVAVSTDSNGRAEVVLRLGSRAGAGSNRVEATATGFTGTAAFTASGTPTAASLITVDSGNNQTGALAGKLAFPFVVVVTDAGFNRLGNVPVTFTVKQGGGAFTGKPTLQMNTDPDGRAAAFLTLGTEPGFDNNVVEANFGGNPGLVATFVASAKAPGNAADTRISGVVLDNSNNPIEGVTVRLFQAHQGNNNNTPIQVGTPVETNAQGQFLIAPAPVGFFKLMADGTTVEEARGVFPTLEFDLVTVAGQDNTLGMPLLLPVLDVVNRLCVDEVTGGTLTLPEVPGFSLTVAAGSATFPGGARSGCITVSTVNADKSPMTPGFGQQPRFLITIQPVGTMFNPPAPITMPNVDGLSPGQVTELYSYDHDLSAFTAIGTGTVSEDGLVVRSDPGVGILKAGWHCGGNPGQTGSAASLSLTVTSGPKIPFLPPIISGTTTISTIGQKFTVTAQGRPPLDGVYRFELLATAPGDDTGAVTISPQPTCPGQPTCVADITPVKAGSVTLRVHFRCTTLTEAGVSPDEVTRDIRIVVLDVELSLKNTGTIVASPENEDYAAEKTAAGGTDSLGPLPIGTGRGDAPFAGSSYISPLMVIGKVIPDEAANLVTFRWNRTYSDRRWHIRLNAARTKWLVTLRSPANENQEDTGASDFNDTTPSPTERKIYIYDNPGQYLVNDAALTVGDFIRSDVAFTYRLQIVNGATVQTIKQVDVGLVIAAKRTATTGTVPGDWTGIEISTAIRTLDRIITEPEVRTIVGGTLPIEIDANANN
jgi:hypothetical protein